MIKQYDAVKNAVAQPRIKRVMRVAVRLTGILILILAAAYIGFAWYIHSHKKEVLAQVTQALNEDIRGTISIRKMEPTFIQGFPRISIRLQEVVIRDSLYNTHKHTFLSAGDMALTVNTLALLRGTILIKKITLKNATVDIFTDKTGYSNSAVFKKGKKTAGSGEGSFPELKKFDLENVSITIDNRKKSKLYKFKANDLTGDMDNTSEGWKADVYINAMVYSLAFNTNKGSFIKDKEVKGNFDIAYNEHSGVIDFRRNKLQIGKEDFFITAKFKTSDPTGAFSINIENKRILWHSASHLLSPNITQKLDMFNLKKPIAVKCDLIGGFNVEGDPLIRVNAEIKNNILNTPGGKIEDCSFFGVFTNEHIKGRGYSDANSAIKIYNFKGTYGEIPFAISKASILDIEQPIATGNFTSDFEVAKLKNLIDDDLIKFTAGRANVQLAFRADIVNFKLAKPLVSGFIKINNATVDYVPRNLNFKDVDVALNFTKDDLYISKIDLKSGKSIVEMEGNIKNFLNLYYTAPEKIVLNWQVYSPQLYLGEFLGFVGGRKRTKSTNTAIRKGNFTEEINTLFEKSSVEMKLRVNKLFYNNFYAQDARADIMLTERGLSIKNAALKHADGFIRVDGTIVQGSNSINTYALNAIVTNVNIKKFFTAFDNFGMETLKSDNLKGLLSSKASISGNVSDAGKMMPKSMNGSLAFTLKNGGLFNFDPVRNVGKFAFPNRDMNNITFANLNGKFDVKGDRVTIHPMQVNSSVLNMDISGIYSFGSGTSIYVDVPIRNPKRDEGITDKDELAKRRNRGIVLHLIAEDDKDGKVKVKLGKKKKKA